MINSPWQIAVEIDLIAPDASVEKQLAAAADADLRLISLKLPNATDGSIQERIRWAAKMTADRGLMIVACDLADLGDANLVAAGREDRNRARDFVRRWLDRASAMGAALLCLPGSAWRPPTGEVSCEEVYYRALDTLLELRFDAQQHATTLACGIPAQAILLSPLEAREFFDRVNSPWVRARVSHGHDSSTLGATDWIAVLRYRVGMICCDAACGQSGSGGLEELVSACVKARFDGIICLAGHESAAAFAKLAAAGAKSENEFQKNSMD